MARPWPKLFRELPAKGECRTLVDMQNGWGTIPAGTVGTYYKHQNWSRLSFVSNKCECCGAKLSISHVHVSKLELI